MQKSLEIVPIGTEHTHGCYETSLYKGMAQRGFRSNFDEVIVFAPGWLGSGTLHYAASTLARHGHDVAVVNHPHTSIFHSSQDRSRDVHFAAQAASKATGKRGVILLGQSNGGPDVHHAAVKALEHQKDDHNNKASYFVTAVGTLAGAGLSGRHVNMAEAQFEALELAKLLWNHPIEELHVVGRSIANFVRHPVRATVEGIGAAVSDVRDDARRIIKNGNLRAYVETYNSDDRVIPRPDRTDVQTYPGGHLASIICADTVPAIVEQLYAGNNPGSLQIAQFATAA